LNSGDFEICDATAIPADPPPRTTTLYEFDGAAGATEASFLVKFPQYYNSELGFGNCAATITPFIAEKSMLCNKPGAQQIAIS
jgi:hypothetical protein